MVAKFYLAYLSVILHDVKKAERKIYIFKDNINGEKDLQQASNGL